MVSTFAGISISPFKFYVWIWGFSSLNLQCWTSFSSVIAVQNPLRKASRVIGIYCAVYTSISCCNKAFSCGFKVKDNFCWMQEADFAKFEYSGSP